LSTIHIWLLCSSLEEKLKTSIRNPNTITMAVGIAIIGSGIFAKEEHLPAIQASPLLSLKAIYSRSLKSAKTLSENLSNVEIYSDDSDGKTFDDLLKRDDIKGVVIA
jgi:predicted dehydrogenase